MLNKVISTISEYHGLPENSIASDSHLTQDLGLSSFDLVSLIGIFEEEFDIEIPDRKLNEIQTVNDIVLFIEDEL